VGPDKQCFRHSRRLLPGFHMLETQASRRISRVMKHTLVRICHHAPTLHFTSVSHRTDTAWKSSTLSVLFHMYKTVLGE